MASKKDLDGDIGHGELQSHRLTEALMKKRRMKIRFGLTMVLSQGSWYV